MLYSYYHCLILFYPMFNVAVLLREVFISGFKLGYIFIGAYRGVSWEKSPYLLSVIKK